jgi:dihydrofolate reductase
MRELILKMSITIDGFVAGPNGEMDWLFENRDDAATAWTVSTLWEAGVHIMGSRTFHDMAAYWPASSEPFAAPMNEIPKVVFSRRGIAIGNQDLTTRGLEDAIRYRSIADISAEPAIVPKGAAWSECRVASGNLDQEIARLKKEPGKNILAHGGARFAQSLVALGVVNEYRLLVHPVALGKGLPLFSELGKPKSFKLVTTMSFPSGTVALIYRPS